MEVLINAGSHTILTKPENANEMIKKAACTCYQSEERTIKSAYEFVEMLIKKKHWSMIEHAGATVRFNDISRGFMAELTRHRLASLAVESTRYVDPTEDPKTGEPGKTNLKVVLPKHKNLKEEFAVAIDPKKQDSYDINDIYAAGSYIKLTPIQMFEKIEQYYKILRESGWAQEDARQILPIATKSEVIITANFTEWRHIFRLRTQKAAHWEIRSVMNKTLEEFKTLFAPVFNDFVIAGKDKNNYEYYKIEGYK